jgi:hypothetical protein
VAATPVLHRLRRKGLPLTEVPRIETWATACCGRPAWIALADAAGV